MVECLFVVVTKICKEFCMWMKAFRNEKKRIFEKKFVASMNFAIAAAAARGDWLRGQEELSD